MPINSLHFILFILWLYIPICEPGVSIRLLASSNLSAGVVEIRLVKFPHGVRRNVKIVETPQDQVDITTPDIESPLASYLSVARKGSILIFTYTGPLIAPKKLVGSSVTLTVPNTFLGFIDSRYN